MTKAFPSRSLGIVIILGSVWGLSEAVLGIGLRSCASFASGSIMTGVALFFIGATWKRTQHIIGPLILVAIASLFKLFDALLLSLPVKNGAVANPIFAFWTEGLALVLMLAFMKERWKGKATGQAFLGGLSALVAVNLFPLVRYATGIPACVFPGTTTPLSFYYAPIAVGVSLLTVPAGFWLGARLEFLETLIAGTGRKPAFRFLVPAATATLCLAVMTLVRLA
jgi:hypothetical protein